MIWSHQNDTPKRREGFTLIELSIVLVIIGLIVGGILVGRDMIRQAGLRSVLTDIEQFKTAITAFEVKYDCLPGDCPNATTFFGAVDSVPNNCIATLTPNAPGDTRTCNGTNDGYIYKSLSWAPVSTWES